ncbi:MAG: flippase-like domain-containing protein [Proteobacteria bacterium]|nr:flippase-like domain-containing protein [Pseudomonadota bacterium]
MQRSGKKTIFLLLKLLISVGLAGYIYFRVDKKGLLLAVKSLSFSGLSVIFALYLVGQIISAYKWRIFVQEVGLKITPMQAIRAYFFGMFVNVFGFGTIGGDVARALALAAPKGLRAGTLATVIADRVQGLTILMIIGTLAVNIFPPEVLGTNLLATLRYGSILALSSLLLSWWIGPTILKKIFHSEHKWGAAAQRVTQAFPHRKEPLVSKSILSFIFHNIQIVMHILIARELGADLSASFIYATVPFVNIVSSLPISLFNGLGVREAMYCLLLIPAGLAQETAVAFGGIWLFTVTVISSFGILLLTPDMKEAVKNGRKERVITPPEFNEELTKKAVGNL